MSAPRIVFFGMEITSDEALDLLNRAAVMCALISGHGRDNGNWAMVQKDARQFQLDIARMHGEPGRRRVFCATCGASRSDASHVAEDDPAFVLRPNPSPAVAEKPSRQETPQSAIGGDLAGQSEIPSSGEQAGASI